MDLEPIVIDRRTVLKGGLGFACGLFSGGKLPPFPMPSTESEPSVAEPTVKESLLLAGHNLISILNPDDNYLPYWQMTVEPDYSAHLARWWPAHNLGRWLDAMYRLQETLGVEIPAKIDRAMLENAKSFFDNPDHISLNPKPWPMAPWVNDEGLQWDLHSLREGLLALNALARWRRSDWAADMGRKMVRSVSSKLRDDGTWDLEAFDACRKRGKEVIHNIQPCDTHGRMLEALIWFYETTGATEALAFADRLAHYHLEHTTSKEGPIPAGAHADHTHSYFGTLSGLLLYGRLTKNREYIDRVDAAYRTNVRRVVHESGYTSHNMVVESFGETTSPGDAAQLALWLYQDGVGSYIDDVDRIVRSRLLPSQIVASPPLKAPKDGLDGHRDLDRRILGGYGGCHNHPHAGKIAVTDVTAADVHTLVDLYRHIAAFEDGRHLVRLHLTAEAPKSSVVSRRAEEAELTVTLKTPGTVAIRVPGWATPSSVRLRVGGKDVPFVRVGDLACTERMRAGETVTLSHDLPARTTTETGLGKTFELDWRGDQVVAVSPNSDFYPFYPDRKAKR